jgi:hypothetical protein
LSTPFHKELVARDPRPPPGRPLSSASADAKALARRTSWWLPGDLTLSRSSPPGKKNFRGAARLRQIEVGYNLLPQVRRDVTDHRHPVSRFARQERRLRHSPSGASRGHRISPDVQAQRRRRTAYFRRKTGNRKDHPGPAAAGGRALASDVGARRFRIWRNTGTAPPLPVRPAPRSYDVDVPRGAGGADGVVPAVASA